MESVTNCPCCKEVLFKTAGMGPEGWPGRLKGSPKLEQEGSEFFMRCSHCNKRVRMVKIETAEGNPSLYQVAAIQPCT